MRLSIFVFLVGVCFASTRRANSTRYSKTFGECNNLHNEGIHSVQIVSSGKARTFELYVPPGLQDNNLRPTLFMWHGYSSNPAKVMQFTNINAFAENEKWLAVYPVGTGLIKGFNGAGCCPGVSANDVQFAKDIISYLSTEMCFDNNNVFSTGFSNGGFMTHRLACEVPQLFKGFAVHSGLIGKTFACSPSQGVPMLMAHGDADTTVPYYGNGNWDAFADVAGRWATNNNCGSEDNAVSTLSTETTQCVRYNNCGKGVPVEFCTVVGLDHHWSGDRNFDVEFTSYLFDFFLSL